MRNDEVSRHLEWSYLTNIIEWRYFLTPLGTECRRWTWNDGRQREYLDFYIFGLRIVRWRL
jgi:hypothetical protein